MKSPFPGMDPYIETCGLWADFHDDLIALQPMIDAIYQRSRYHRSIDYAQPAAPPLSAGEQTWLAEQLRMP